jgi:signal peptidase II
MILVIAGAIGNLIDRIYMGYVVDFIHFYTKSRDLPVFNVADISVVIGTFILATSLIFSKE